MSKEAMQQRIQELVQEVDKSAGAHHVLVGRLQEAQLQYQRLIEAEGAAEEAPVVEGELVA